MGHSPLNELTICYWFTGHSNLFQNIPFIERVLEHSIFTHMCSLSVCSVAHFIYVSPVGGLAIYCTAWSTPFLVSLTICSPASLCN